MIKKLNLESNLARVHDWTKAADQKVSIFLAFQGVVCTILFSGVFGWARANWNLFSCLNLIFLILALFFIARSFYFSITAITPSLKNESMKKSLIYFGDIAEVELAKYRNAVMNLSAKNYEEDLIGQIHTCSKIVLRKHLLFRSAIHTFVVGMILLILSYVIFLK